MRGLLPKVKRWLRRQRECYLPDEQTRTYRRWIAQRLSERAGRLRGPLEPGLFSIITAVWDGSPAEYFATLAETISRQNCEWVICDNGCRREELVSILNRLRTLSNVIITGDGSNAGIARGLRSCLEAASGRYAVPVDADDNLYPDALQVASDFIREHNYPALLYSDEDKVIGMKSSQPYFKPEFDPVLLANSAYTAHLGFVDREKALALGAYTNTAVEGSVDWELFLRFVSAGYKPVHIPEVLYQWRIHTESTADDSAAKDYVGRSQRAALQLFLDRHPAGANFTVVESPLLPGGAHYRLLRSRNIAPLPYRVLRLDNLREQASNLPPDIHMVFVSDGESETDWIFEASGIFELFPDTAVVGGRLIDANGRVLDADRHFGFGAGYASPNAGRRKEDAGYFGQMFKQRSTSAVSPRLMAVDREFLDATLRTLPADRSLSVGLGLRAIEQGRRIVYSPYISAVLPPKESAEHSRIQLCPDRRFYPKPFSLRRPFQIE